MFMLQRGLQLENPKVYTKLMKGYKGQWHWTGSTKTPVLEFSSSKLGLKIFGRVSIAAL